MLLQIQQSRKKKRAEKMNYCSGIKYNVKLITMKYASQQLGLSVSLTHTSSGPVCRTTLSAIQSFASWLFIFISLRFSIHHTAVCNRNELMVRIA